MTNKGKQAGTQIKAATDSVALRNLNRLGGEPRSEKGKIKSNWNGAAV